MLEVAAFDPLENIGDDISDVFDLEKDDKQFTINFASLGMDSSFQLVNTGTLNFNLILYPLFMVLIWFIPKWTRKFPKVNNFFRKLRDETFFNGILIFFDGIFIPLMI